MTRAKGHLVQLEKNLKRTKSDSQRKNLERQIDGKTRELDRVEKALGSAEGDLSKAEQALAACQEKLVKQEDADQKAAERKAKQDAHRKEQAERTEATKREREEKEKDRKREAREASQDAEITGLHTRASGLEERLLAAERAKAPPAATVLFLAASPEDEDPLRLDKETRLIQKRMWATGYRDSIHFEWRLARQVSDLIQDLNETRPDILHFSGHGNSRELCFEDGEGQADSLTNDQLGRLLDAAPSQIRIVVFNSCDSVAQAKLATGRVEISVGMETTVDDDAAQTFAAEFYNSLGFGNSVSKAFDQAKFQVEAEHGIGHEVPQLFWAEGVDPLTVALVNPDD